MTKRFVLRLAVATALFPFVGFAQTPSPSPVAELQPVTVTATRLDTPEDRSPSAISVISDSAIELHQYRFVSDALQSVPGVNVVQTGTPGQVTSVFIRGTRSDQTQILLDGIPFNQGLSGAFNFADFTNDNISRIEVIRGPQSALYGSQASGGVINLITRRGEDQPTGSAYFEGGSYDSFREASGASGRLGPLDFSFGISRYDTENSRQNNGYRSLALLGDVGFSPIPALRIGLVYYYDYADAGSPNTIFNPQSVDSLRTERWLLAPTLEFTPTEWWKNKVYFAYDQERQINNPNRLDPFTGPTRGVFRRSQFEYQSDITPATWLTLTAGTYYNHIDVYQERPQTLLGNPLIRDKTDNTAGFGQLKLTPLKNLDLYGGIRYDAFSGFAGRFTYRLAGNYVVPCTGTIFRSSYGTGFTPPSSQDKIFGGNPQLLADRDKGFDIGLEQPLANDRLRIGANFFYSTSSNTVGFNSNFVAFNLGKDRIQGVELFAVLRPLPNLTLSGSYTYLDAITTSGADISQPAGSRLPRRPRNQFYGSISYEWCRRFDTTLELVTVNARQDENFGAPNVNLEDYTVLRFACEYHVTDFFSVFGRIENLTDEKYAEVNGFPALGRTFYGGLRLHF
jgi:vitamin B12 transporter